MASLYVHIPFCEHKCIYCDFYSIAPSEERMDEKRLMEVFTDRVEREIRQRAASGGTFPAVDTIFFGGGTPSLLEPEQAEGILRTLHDVYAVRPDAEITMEANPGTVTRDRLRSFRMAGFNRLSFGVQSFHADDLVFLTRIHSAEQADRSVDDARAAGFDNLNIDLMFGLPNQTPARWSETLEHALHLGPEHLSCYSLTVEPNTPLARMVASGAVTLLDRGIDADLYEHTVTRLSDAGYQQYEVSNFCRPGRQSRHNLNYWTHGEYLGFGPSAHSYRDGVRWWNSANLSLYVDRVTRGDVPEEGAERLTAEQLRTEQIFLGLRGPGLNLERYEQQFGRSFVDEQGDRVRRLLEDGRAVIDGPMFTLTRAGYMVCDEICATLT